MIGSLAGCCWWRSDPDKETRLTKDERLKTKKILCALSKLDCAAKEAYPIALVGFTGWALIWLYRGLKYPSVRGKVPLNRYVDRTFHIAKTFGVATFLAGLFYTVSHVEQIKEGKDEVKVNIEKGENKEKVDKREKEVVKVEVNIKEKDVEKKK